MRKTVSLFLCMFFSLMLLFSPATIAWADESTNPETTYAPDVSHNKETGYYLRIDDQADLLTETEEKELKKVMEPITTYGNVAFVSISKNPEYSTNRYAEKYYEEQFGYSSGIIFLIDMEERYLWIYSNGEIYKTITKSYANTITDNVYPYASDREYLTCASTAFAQINTLLEGRHIAQPMKYISNALLAIVLAFFINYFLVMTLSRSRKANTSQLLNGIFSKAEIRNPQTTFVNQTKRYSPQQSSSSGSRSSGSSRSFSGGGSRGGGGGHRF